MNKISRQLFKIAREIKASDANINNLKKIDQVGSCSLYEITENDFQVFSSICSETMWCNARNNNFFGMYLPCYLVMKNNKPQALINLQGKLFRDE